MIPVISNLTTAGLVFVYDVTVKKLNPWSVELYPDPVDESSWIPSTNICSPTSNTEVENPATGVTNVHVTIPIVLVVDIPTTWDIDTPFELLMVLILCSMGFNPLGELITFTSLTELDDNSNSITPWSVSSPVSGSTTTKSGAEM